MWHEWQKIDMLEYRKRRKLNPVPLNQHRMSGCCNLGWKEFLDPLDVFPYIPARQSYSDERIMIYNQEDL